MLTAWEVGHLGDELRNSHVMLGVLTQGGGGGSQGECLGQRGSSLATFGADGVKSSVCHSGRTDNQEEKDTLWLLLTCVRLTIDLM